ncbi:MAG: bifunctional riboflavin kinase/FAD synthetase [Actinomycetaceae bacterium]|nr:bifunctional riboflavin kinase/FAD synthetase [Arcanobacterium sp.]MDD7504527.1 bifunctional riboflavin kinase/FAD synthetase [Actinomycetaceae bacterium]MDY6142804.1 bifunctional riboflavin kinase/FAD synthetase [Arcanobacterium sp.]
MEIWARASDVPKDFSPTVVTIGIFDGMHRGHQAVLTETVDTAKELGCKSLVLTFDPHPRQIHDPDCDLHLVTSVQDRLERLEGFGVDGVVVEHYDKEYARLSAHDFVQQELVGKLHAHAIVVGADARFGAGNEGDVRFLQRIGAQLGVVVRVVDDLASHEGRRWSSTWVRELLARGDVEGAWRILGRPHRIRGIVRHGYKRGRELGFPTANLYGENLGELPADGVYAGWLIRQVAGTKAAEYLPAAISIGLNPQFGAEQRTVEAHVLGRADLNLYDEAIAIDFIEYLRPMMKMNSVEELLSQMDDDLRRSAQALGVPVSHRVNPAEVTAR